jgi:hypothetical protein
MTGDIHSRPRQPTGSQSREPNQAGRSSRGSPAVFASLLVRLQPHRTGFSVLETWLHMAQVRTSETLGAFIQTATDRITDHDAKNWFDHYGYHLH